MAFGAWWRWRLVACPARAPFCGLIRALEVLDLGRGSYHTTPAVCGKASKTSHEKTSDKPFYVNPPGVAPKRQPRGLLGDASLLLDRTE